MARYMIKEKWEVQKIVMMFEMVLMPIIGTWLLMTSSLNVFNPIWLINCTIDVCGMVIATLLFMSVIKDRKDLTVQTACFSYMLVLTSMILLSDLVSWRFSGIPSKRTVHMVARECYFVLSSLIPLMFWHYVAEASDSEDPKLDLMSKFADIVCLISILSVIGNGIWKYFFEISVYGTLKTTKSFPLILLYTVIIVIMCFVLILRKYANAEKRKVLLTFITMPALAGILEAFIFRISFAYFWLVGAQLLIYGNVFTQRGKELAEKNLEIMTKENELLVAKQEHQRLETELNLAADIQTKVLPIVFPPFPGRDEFDLYAKMTPAKEVGGDFYDFFLIDDDHLAMVIADVSGKGIPAALYMMIAKTMIKNAAITRATPKEILEFVNQQLCEGSGGEIEMFVTVWVGILEISTGRLTAANAGHEYPAVKHIIAGPAKQEDGLQEEDKENRKFDLYKDKHGFVLGGMEDMPYKEYEITLEKGSTLFVYTDGVAEATNIDNQLFGTERMLQALNQNPDASPEELITNVQKSIDEFVEGEPQFDDITMLALRMN